VNKLDTMRRRNDIARLVRANNRCGSHRNCIRINVGNTLAHELTKLEIARERMIAGHEIITEAEFVTGGRADILDLDEAEVIEVLASESEHEALIKARKYPQQLRITTMRIRKEGDANGTRNSEA